MHCLPQDTFRKSMKNFIDRSYAHVEPFLTLIQVLLAFGYGIQSKEGMDAVRVRSWVWVEGTNTPPAC